MINSVIMKWMGEIGAGHSVTALYEVKLYPDILMAKLNSLRWETRYARLLKSRDYDTVRSRLTLRKPTHVAPWWWLNMPGTEGSYWAESSMDDVYDKPAHRQRYLYRDDAMESLMDLVVSEAQDRSSC